MRRRTILVGLAALCTPGVLRSQTAAEDIRDTATGAQLSVRDLIDRLEQADTILIGERHGFAPHQDREAFILQALAERGRYPTLALEMLEPAQEPIIAAYRRENPEYARGLGVALDWSNTGWPDWSFYEPVFQAAFTARLKIVAADLPRDEQRRIEMEGTDERPDDMGVIERWEDALSPLYGKTRSPDNLRKQALMQWRRDQKMAAMLTGKSAAILICGMEHVKPFAVPSHIEAGNRPTILTFDRAIEASKNMDTLVWHQLV